MTITAEEPQAAEIAKDKIDDEKDEKDELKHALEHDDKKTPNEDEQKALNDAKKLEEENAAKKSEEELKKIEDAKLARQTPDELSELRQITREQRRALQVQEDKYNDLIKRMKEADIHGEDKADPNVEMLHQMRSMQLDNLIAVMEVNPKYEDVKEVCSAANFGDLVDALANAVQAKQGGNIDDIVKEIESDIWKLPNPYAFIYEQVKAHHPKYVKSNTDDKGKNGEKGGKDKKKDIPKVPPSINDTLGGSDKGMTGWTAARIDALDEKELDNVPKDIYAKYLRNKLD